MQYVLLYQIYFFYYKNGEIIKGKYSKSGIFNKIDNILKDEIIYMPISSIFNFDDIDDKYNLKEIMIPVDDNLSIIYSDKIKYIKSD